MSQPELSESQLSEMSEVQQIELSTELSLLNEEDGDNLVNALRESREVEQERRKQKQRGQEVTPPRGPPAASSATPDVKRLRLPNSMAAGRKGVPKEQDEVLELSDDDAKALPNSKARGKAALPKEGDEVLVLEDFGGCKAHVCAQVPVPVPVPPPKEKAPEKAPCEEPPPQLVAAPRRAFEAWLDEVPVRRQTLLKANVTEAQRVLFGEAADMRDESEFVMAMRRMVVLAAQSDAEAAALKRDVASGVAGMHSFGEHEFVAEQELFYTLAQDPSCTVLGLGSAGTGKTLVMQKLALEVEAPSCANISVNTHLQANMWRVMLRADGGWLGEGLAEVDEGAVRTRAACFGGGYGHFDRAIVDAVALARLVDEVSAKPSKKVKAMAEAELSINDEALQWQAGFATFAIKVRRQVRAKLRAEGRLPGDAPELGRLIFGGDGKQIFPVPNKILAQRARDAKAAWPLEETMLDDGALLRMPNARVVAFRQVLRQASPADAATLTRWGVGKVDDAGWARAQQLMANAEAPEGTHLFGWNSDARDAAFEQLPIRARASSTKYLVHVDANGDRMEEADLRECEDKYFYHKTVLIPGEKVLLVVPEERQRAAQFKFREGMAFSNMEAEVVGFEGAKLDMSDPTGLRYVTTAETKVTVRCAGRPAGDDELVLRLDRREVNTSDGKRWISGLNMKSKRYRTFASVQGETLDATIVHAEHVKEGWLYVGLTRTRSLDNVALRDVRNRREFEVKLRQHPKVLLMEAALGAELSAEDVRVAMSAILNNESKYRAAEHRNGTRTIERNYDDGTETTDNGCHHMGRSTAKQAGPSGA